MFKKRMYGKWYYKTVKHVQMQEHVGNRRLDHYFASSASKGDQ